MSGHFLKNEVRKQVLNWATIFSRAAAPCILARALSVKYSCRASAISCASEETIRPFMPSLISSVVPDIEVTIDGKPVDMASTKALGIPSLRDTRL